MCKGPVWEPAKHIAVKTERGWGARLHKGANPPSFLLLEGGAVLGGEMLGERIRKMMSGGPETPISIQSGGAWRRGPSGGGERGRV